MACKDKRFGQVWSSQNKKRKKKIKKKKLKIPPQFLSRRRK